MRSAEGSGVVNSAHQSTYAALQDTRQELCLAEEGCSVLRRKVHTVINRIRSPTHPLLLIARATLRLPSGPETFLCTKSPQSRGRRHPRGSRVHALCGRVGKASESPWKRKRAKRSTREESSWEVQECYGRPRAPTPPSAMRVASSKDDDEDIHTVWTPGIDCCCAMRKISRLTLAQSPDQWCGNVQLGRGIYTAARGVICCLALETESSHEAGQQPLPCDTTPIMSSMSEPHRSDK